MFNNEEIKDAGGWLEAGVHQVHVFSFKTEEFLNRNSEMREKAIIQFKGKDDLSHFEDFLTMESCQWRLKQLSVACGIGKNDKWDFPDLLGKPLAIHLKDASYTDKTGMKKTKTEIYKFEPAGRLNKEVIEILKIAESEKGTSDLETDNPGISDPF